MSDSRAIRVLIVDDSTTAQRVIADVLATDPGIVVVGTACDGRDARRQVAKLRPDVLTLDIEMPGIDGLTFLRGLMRYSPLPVVVVSSLLRSSTEAALEALRLGAVEVLAKPDTHAGFADFRQQLGDRIRMAAEARPRTPAAAQLAARPEPSLAPGEFGQTVIAIGASTGGTEAIAAILAQLPDDSPGVLIVQHLPESFSEAFARRLDGLSRLKVRQAQRRDELRPGLALVAPGNSHMTLRCANNRNLIHLDDGPPVNYHRPSVDVLFESVAVFARSNAIGILLTGMGVDGARGLLALRMAGAGTLAQDEATSVVYGMPRAALECGAVDRGTPLGMLPSRLSAMLDSRIRAAVRGPAGGSGIRSGG